MPDTIHQFGRPAFGSGTFGVLVPPLAISPASAPAGSAATLAISAPLAAWRAASESALFASPGLNLAGATVSGPGTASVSFVVPNTPGGSVEITDTSTGQTATLQITGSPPLPYCVGDDTSYPGFFEA